MSEPGGMGLLYRIFRLAFRIGLGIYNRLTVDGLEHIPREGGCLVACNHNSYLDPPAIACVVHFRPFRFVARDTLWKKGISHWFFQSMNCIPIQRGSGDLGAIRNVLKAVKEGGLVALFPEGTRSEDGSTGTAKPGIGFIVARAGVPIVPAFIQGSHRAYSRGSKWVRPVKLTVRYGVPIQPSELPTIQEKKPDYGEISRFIMGRISELSAAGE